MKTGLWLFLPAILFTCSLQAAEDVYTGKADVKFSGSSNLHPFDGSVSDVPLRVQVKTAGDGSSKLWMSTEVTIKDMTTNHRKRDKDMWKMFDYLSFPVLKVSVEGAPLDEARPEAGKSGKLPVKLVVAGKQTRVQGVTQNLVEPPDGGSFDLKLTLSLKAMGLQAPTAMFGALQVNDRVEALCRVTLRKE